MANIAHAGMGESCRVNSGLIARHDAALKATENRLNRVERDHERLEKGQKELSEKLSEVREKLFNGYDTKITATNDRVTEIVAMLKDLSKRGGLDEVQIESIVRKKLDEREASNKTEVRWLKRHRIELLSIFVAVCMLAMVILTYIRGA